MALGFDVLRHGRFLDLSRLIFTKPDRLAPFGLSCVTIDIDRMSAERPDRSGPAEVVGALTRTIPANPLEDVRQPRRRRYVQLFGRGSTY